MLRFAFVALFLACKSDVVAVTTTTSVEVCTSDSECTLTSLGDDCCDHCGERAVTKKALDDLHARCKDKHPRCPSIDCPFQPATPKCISNRCVAVH